jgi:hypothetical protein
VHTGFEYQTDLDFINSQDASIQHGISTYDTYNGFGNFTVFRITTHCIICTTKKIIHNT